MRKVILATLFVIFALPVAQAGNPGVDANYCVSMQRKGEQSIFKNNCGEKVFVIWCGNQAYTKKRCGDGPDGGYYTSSANIQPGKSYTVGGFKGQITWGACKGSIGFGHEEYSDSLGGSYVCKKR
jgi:hypothetical protein